MQQGKQRVLNFIVIAVEVFQYLSAVREPDRFATRRKLKQLLSVEATIGIEVDQGDEQLAAADHPSHIKAFVFCSLSNKCFPLIILLKLLKDSHFIFSFVSKRLFVMGTRRSSRNFYFLFN